MVDGCKLSISVQFSGCLCLVGISSPPSGSAGVVGGSQTYEVLGLESSRIAAAKTEVEGSLLARKCNKTNYFLFSYGKVKMEKFAKCSKLV